MSDAISDEWALAGPLVHQHVFRDEKTGHVMVMTHAIFRGCAIWQRKIDLGAAPSYGMIRETARKLGDDAWGALEGQR